MVSFSRVAFGTTLPNAKSIHQKAFLESSAKAAVDLAKGGEQSRIRGLAHSKFALNFKDITLLGAAVSLATFGLNFMTPLGAIGTTIGGAAFTLAKAGLFTGLSSLFLGHIFSGDARAKKEAIRQLEKKVNEITQAEITPAT